MVSIRLSALPVFMLLLPAALSAAQSPVSPGASEFLWQSSGVDHAYGFPDTKAKRSGVLTLDATKLTFRTKDSTSRVDVSSITAVESGSERVELWGTGGRILRLAIPDGGGLAAAAVMHHRVGMLSVEYRDTRGGLHGAVFTLPVKEAEQAMHSFDGRVAAPAATVPAGCGGGAVEPGSVVVERPDWSRAEVPAAYRSLVYEHVIERMRANGRLGHVYRAGEVGAGGACPAISIRIAIETFRRGNQVMRAATGPIGMFTSATQMTFQVTYLDGTGAVMKTDRIKASVRTESESTGVADGVAKKLTRQYAALLRASGKTGGTATTAESPREAIASRG